jgi:large subunit ribosomal protein L10
VVIVKYSGLTVEDATALRAQFRANGVDYVVLKNTLVRRALQELNIEGLDEVLNGPSAFAFGMSDPVSPAKIVSDFITKKKNESPIEIKAGLLGTELMDAAQIKALADVPSREVLLARLLGSLQSSVAGFVRVLDAIAKKDGEAAPEA